MKDHFIPHTFMKNPHVQTILGSSRWRAARARLLERTTKVMMVDGGNGIKLLGYHTPPMDKATERLVLIVHGWEGSAHSPYMRSLGAFLLGKGFEIFRLNLRDHGDSHHLNEGLFHGALTDEVYTAVRNVTGTLGVGKVCFLVGFSLGGNFALRVAARATPDDMPGLHHVIAVSPALDPYQATKTIDSSFIYRKYFLNKWKRSLRKKQALFPHRYDFNGALKLRTCLALTEAIMPYYPQFKDYRDYFHHYTLKNGSLGRLSIPVTIIASEDDPIVPVEDLRKIGKHQLLRVIITTYGGHCGFLDSFPFSCWYEHQIADIISEHTNL